MKVYNKNKDQQPIDDNGDVVEVQHLHRASVGDKLYTFDSREEYINWMIKENPDNERTFFPERFPPVEFIPEKIDGSLIDIDSLTDEQIKKISERLNKK